MGSVTTVTHERVVPPSQAWYTRQQQQRKVTTMDTSKHSVYIDGQYEWNVRYHKAGELIASSAWFSTEDEADAFISQLTEKGQ